MTGAPQWNQMSLKDFEPVAEAIGRGDVRDAAVAVSRLLRTALGRPVAGPLSAAVVGAARKLLQLRPNRRLANAGKRIDAERVEQAQLAKLLYIVTMQAHTIADCVEALTFDQLEAILIEALRPLVENDRPAGLELP
jgi:hypothetical protein